MNKVLATIVAVTMVFSASMVFAQEAAEVISAKPVIEQPVQNVGSIKGEIKEVSKDRVRVIGEGLVKDVILHIQGDTYIVNTQDGTKIPVQDLKQGDAITAYYGPALTRSLPPQGNAIALVVGTPEKGNAGMYMKVAKLQENKDGSIRVLCTNGERLVTISPDKFAQSSDIKEGSELIVWYDVMTMSIPAQATATKVVLLPAKADIRVHTLAGTIVVNGKELALGENDIIKNSNSTVMLPLRAIAESLGFKTVWHNENNTVELINNSRTVMLTIGSQEYSRDNRTVQLDYVPEIVNGKTLVPVEFFTDVLKLKVEISNSHV